METSVKTIELTEKQLQEQLTRILEKRASELKKALKMYRPVYIYKTILKVKRNYFYCRIEDGNFSEKEVKLLIKANLIKK